MDMKNYLQGCDAKQWGTTYCEDLSPWSWRQYVLKF
jgi:hypothetical protein